MSATAGFALQLTRPAVATVVPELRAAVVDAARSAGAGATTLQAVRLAVSEALSNAVVHAYAGCGDPGPVHVRAAVEDDRLLVTVADEGRGMAPRVDSPGLGLGVPLIAQAVDELDIALRAAGGTELRMVFRLGG